MAGKWGNADLVATQRTARRDHGLLPSIVPRVVCHKLSKSCYSIFLNKSVPIVHCLVCQGMLARSRASRWQVCQGNSQCASCPVHRLC
jgi:hypothetical protein